MNNILTLSTPWNLNRGISRIAFLHRHKLRQKEISICGSFSNFNNRVFGLICFIVSVLMRVVHIKSLNYRGKTWLTVDKKERHGSLTRNLLSWARLWSDGRTLHCNHGILFRMIVNCKRLVFWPQSAFCSWAKLSLVQQLTYPLCFVLICQMNKNSTKYAAHCFYVT